MSKNWQRGFPWRDGAWTWHQDPRAIHHDGVTYLGYNSSEGYIHVLSYDHGDGAIEETFIKDYYATTHAGPSLLVRDDGHIMVFYARVDDNIRCKVSEDPNDISSFGSEQTFSATSNASFPNPVEVDGEIYVMYRGSSGEDYNQFFHRSTDGGDSWSDSIQLTDTNENRSYSKKRAHNGEIYITIHSANLDDTGLSDWLAVVKYDPDDRAVYDLDGSHIADEDDLPVSKSDVTVFEESSSTDEQQRRIWDLYVEDSDDVRVLYSDIENVESHTYHHARWDGTDWSKNEITTGGYGISPHREYYSGGMCFDGRDPNNLYLSRTETGQHEIWTADTTDDGDSWSVDQLTEDSANSNIRPCQIHYAHDDVGVVWLHGTFDDLSTYNLRVTSEMDTQYSRRIPGYVGGPGASIAADTDP